jgi:O-antigen/teichoic acid export membrane protein
VIVEAVEGCRQVSIVTIEISGATWAMMSTRTTLSPAKLERHGHPTQHLLGRPVLEPGEPSLGGTVPWAGVKCFGQHGSIERRRSKQSRTSAIRQYSQPALTPISDPIVNAINHRRPDSAALIAGTIVSGICVYAVSIIGTRVYGTATFAPISVLWTCWAVLVAVLTFPIQHWIIHRIAADGSEDAVASAVPRFIAAGAALATVLATIAWLFGERLFGDHRIIWPLLLGVLTVGTALTGVTRGVLAGRRRFRSVAVVIAAENVVRLGACVAVVVAGASIGAFGVAFVTGAACVAAWPSAFRFAGRARPDPAALIGFISGLGAGSVLSQVVLNAGPLVLSAMGADPDEVTSLFVTMAIFRAPYVVALGLSVQLTGVVTRMNVSGRRRQLRRLVDRIVAVTLGLAAIAVVFGGAVGPDLVAAIYGTSTAPSAAVVGMIAAASVVALGTLALSVIRASQAAAGYVAASWSLAVLAAIIVITLAPLEPITSVTVGFLAAEVVALIAMLIASR